MRYGLQNIVKIAGQKWTDAFVEKGRGNEKMMKLKTCPFCGGLPSWTIFNGGYLLTCANPNCKAILRAEGVTEKEASNKWNTRTKESSMAAHDNINHPSHYETNGIECIVAMEAAQGMGAVQDFCICNAFKYVWRYKHKNGAEDIKKAVWYLNKWLELEKEDNND